MATFKVRYRGLSDVRLIRHNDPGLKERGIKVDHDLRWTRGGVVFIEGMSEELEQLFKDEGTFDVTEVKDQEGMREVKEVVKASRADDTGATVVDGTTGQKSQKPGA